MALFAGITGLLSVLVGWLVTVRLLSLARRTHAVPEQLLALGFGGLFCVGYPMTGASRAPGLVMTNEGALLFALGTLGMAVGIGAFGRFPFVVFRPAATWARMLSAGIIVLGLVGSAGCATTVAFAETHHEMVTGIQPWALALTTAICLSFAWNGVESIRYYRTMKRRQALGLAKADTTHRFLLWGLASLVSTACVLSVIVFRASGLAILTAGPMAIIGSSTLVTTMCWWLAFFMPKAYRRRVVGPEPAAVPTPD